MRWLWILLSVACFAIVFRTHSMGLAALCLLAALAFILLATLGFAASRIEQRSRNEATMLSGEDLRRMRTEIERRKQASDTVAGESDDSLAATREDRDTDSVGGSDDRRA
jgi:hypothetical protein